MVRQRRNLARTKRCGLCLSNTIVDYKDTVLLRKYISERGKILGRARTRICAKHQRQLTKSIKRARILALLPFVQS